MRDPPGSAEEDITGSTSVSGGVAPGVGTRIHTFVIADVRGYTSFTHERGDEAAAALAGTFAAAAGEGAVWVAYSDRHLRPAGDPQWSSSLDVVDPRAGKRTERVRLSSDPEDIETRDGFVWVAIDTGDTIWRFNARPPHLDGTIAAGDDPISLTFDESLWVANQSDAAVTKFDGRTGERLAVIPVDHTLEGIAATDRELWVAIRNP